MKTLSRLLLVVPVLCGSLLSAQEPPASKAGAEHEWLKQFVGQWESQAEAVMVPGEPAVTCNGEMSYRMLGDLWLIGDATMAAADPPVRAIQTIGYSPEQKKYVGTWVDSMFNHLWQYEGSVDESGRILTLEADGPNLASPGETTKYRDVYEFKSADHIVATSSMLGPDGQWVTFMRGNMHRIK